MLLLALPLTAGAAALVNWFAESGTWFHEFFFNRRFVQWVLMYAFFVGMLGAIRRIPQLYRDHAFARRIHPATDPDTAPHRWQGVLKAKFITGPAELGVYLAALKESEASEVEGGYRIPADVTQLLPLIGFFGTVFGLSLGLYNSFLVQGDATTRSFATAIAIAFDNTLLGLALTIVLFAATSILRKADEGVSARIEQLGNEALKDLFLRKRDHEIVLAGGTARLERELEVLRESTKRLEAILPAATEHTAALANAVGRACVMLEKTIRQQHQATAALIGDAGRMDREAAVNLDRAIRTLQRNRSAAHSKLADVLKRTIKRRNRELIEGLNAALWQPRTIVVMDGAGQPPGNGTTRPQPSKDGAYGSRTPR